MGHEFKYVAFLDLMGFADGQETLADEDAVTLSRMSGEWLLHPQLSRCAVFRSDLLGPERHHRIHARHAPRRDGAREDCDRHDAH